MLNNKALRYTIAALFTLGAIALIGILSFSGMFYLTSNIGAAVASAIFAVIIEGEIYKQNILSGTNSLLHMGKFLELSNYRKVLQQLSMDKNNREQCAILRDYHKLSKYRNALMHLRFMSKEQRAELTRTEARIAEIEAFFTRYLNNQLQGELNPIELKLKKSLDRTIGNERAATLEKLKKNLKRERIMLWATMPITVIGGFMTALVMAPQISAALVFFGVAMSATVMCACVWPLAAIIAVGAMIMVYKTFIDIIHHKTLQKHWTSFKTKFNEGGPVIKTLYVVGMVLLIGLAVAATVATAATWWNAAQAGLLLLPYLAPAANVVKNVITAIGIGLMGLGHLDFDYTNSLESFETLTAKASLSAVPKANRAEVAAMSPIKKSFTLLKYRAAHAYAHWLKKPLYQRCNPFTWINTVIEIPFRAAIILGHLISIGVTGDRLGNVPPVVTATIGSLQEGATDLHYITNHDDHDHHHEHVHDDHHHSDLAGFFLNILLAPLKCAAAGWNAVGGEKNFTDCLKKEFGIAKKKQLPAAKVSVQWQRYELDQKLSKEIHRLKKPAENADIAFDKREVFKATRRRLRNPHANQSPLVSQDDLAVLSQNRNALYAKSIPKSLQTIHEAEVEFPKLYFAG